MRSSCFLLLILIPHSAAVPEIGQDPTLRNTCRSAGICRLPSQGPMQPLLTLTSNAFMEWLPCEGLCRGPRTCCRILNDCEYHPLTSLKELHYLLPNPIEIEWVPTLTLLAAQWHSWSHLSREDRAWRQSPFRNH